MTTMFYYTGMVLWVGLAVVVFGMRVLPAVLCGILALFQHPALRIRDPLFPAPRIFWDVLVSPLHNNCWHEVVFLWGLSVFYHRE